MSLLNGWSQPREGTRDAYRCNDLSSMVPDGGRDGKRSSVEIFESNVEPGFANLSQAAADALSASLRVRRESLQLL